jgi:AbrB family looped-hinge helix DNA binding protein
MDRITTITSKGQVTIPKAVRDALGLVPGDKIEFWVEGGRVRFRKADPTRQESAGSTPIRDAPPQEQDDGIQNQRVTVRARKTA